MSSDFSRLVPGVRRRWNRFDARVPDGKGGRIFLGTFATESEAEAAVREARELRGYPATRFAGPIDMGESGSRFNAGLDFLM